MAKVRFNPPIQWENWCGWLLAIWLCISPGPLKFGDDVTATYVAVLTGIVLICTEMLTISPFRLWEEWINVFVGGWQNSCRIWSSSDRPLATAPGIAQF